MFIVSGVKRFKKVLMTESRRTECGSCHHTTRFQVIRVISWVTFFWIPIFPYSLKYYLICPNCQSGYKIKRQDVKNYLSSDFGCGTITIK